MFARLITPLAVALSATTLNAQSLRSIPLTENAEALVASTREALPADWTYLGQIRPTPTSEVKSSLLGIGGETLDRDFADFDAYLTYLEPLGAKRIRLQSGWAKTESRIGEYDFEWLDNIIDQSLAIGIEPWLQLSYGNTLYEGAGGTGLGEGLIRSEKGFAAWDRYVTETVLRYQDSVDYYEIWNEADINHRYLEEGESQAATAYAKLFVRTSEIVRQHDPEAFIVGLALAGVGNREVVRSFVEYLKSNDKLHLLDSISIHGYPANPDNNFEHLSWLQTYLDLNAPGTTIWQGETGAPSERQPQFALKNLDWSELSQAKWNGRRALAHIGRGIPYSQFQISDMRYSQKRHNTLNTKGLLVTTEDLQIERPKLAYFAYQNLCSLFANSIAPSESPTECDSPHKSLSAFTFTDRLHGKTLHAVWDNAQRPTESLERSPATLTISASRIRDAVYIDLTSGCVFAPDTEAYQLTGTTLTFFDLPIWDAPIVLADRTSVAKLLIHAQH